MSKAIDNLEEAQKRAMAYAAKAGRLSVSGRDLAARGRNTELLVLARMPEPVSD